MVAVGGLLVASRLICGYHHPDGRGCGAPPLRDGPFCLFHDPDHSDAVAEARRVAGQRRRKDATVATVYDLDDVTSDAGTKRLLQIAVLDLLGLPNDLPRARALLVAVQTSIKVREAGDTEKRLAALEAIINRQGEGLAPFAGADALTREEADDESD
jgi:hypothetical protein